MALKKKTIEAEKPSADVGVTVNAGIKIPFIYVCPELIDKPSRERIFKELNILTWAPKHETNGSACVDFRSATTIKVPPMRVRAVPTGLACSLPEGFELSARSRSGLFVKKQIFIVGTIDDDYRGEIKVLLANFGEDDFEINFGDRIAQFKLSTYCKQDWQLVDELSKTDRGASGFGHTGMK